VDTVPRAVQSARIYRLKIMSNVDITETSGLPTSTVDHRAARGPAGRPQYATLPTGMGRETSWGPGNRRLEPRNSPLGFTEANYTRDSDRQQCPHGMVLVPDRVPAVHNPVATH